MAKSKITPIGDRVLVKHIEEKEQVRGGIIIPDAAKEKPQEAEVIALGTGKKDESAVMGASGAVEVLHAKELAAFESAEEKAKFVAEKEQEYRDKFSNPYNAARYGYIDDVIEPRNTRFRIIRALQSLATKRLQNPAKKHSNIPL